MFTSSRSIILSCSAEIIEGFDCFSVCRLELGRLVNSSGTTSKQYSALLGLLGWIHGMSSPVQMDSKVAAGILQLVQDLVAIAEVKVIVSRFHTTCLTIHNLPWFY